jgi:hypothetical protein
VSTAWVAGAVRAKALAGRRVGAGGARTIAARPSLGDALGLLGRTSYGRDVRADQTLGEAQHAVGATLLWNLRVLAGWLPRGGAETLRLLAAGFEVANVDEHLAGLRGEHADPSYALGTLATAWPRLARTTTTADLAAALGSSPWRVRDERSHHDLALGLHLAWAEAVAARLPEAATWARAGTAALVAREVLLEQRPLSDPLSHRASLVLGPAFVTAAATARDDLGQLAHALPAGTRWVLEGLRRPEDVWRAEATWWQRVERDGFALLRGTVHDRGPVVGAVAVLAVDAWRVRAALETAARGGAGRALEAFDGVA